MLLLPPHHATASLRPMRSAHLIAQDLHSSLPFRQHCSLAFTNAASPTHASYMPRCLAIRVPHRPPSYYSSSSALTAHPITAAAIAAATTTTTASSHASPTFTQLLGAFITGGIFFSTTITAFAVFFAMGAENFKRVLDVRKLVIQRVWNIFLIGLSATRKALRADAKWHWKDALRVLRQGLDETRRAAAEGVEAIRLEASLYAAAFGKPGLIALQYFIDHLTPKLLKSSLEESMTEALAKVNDKYVKHVELHEFDIGHKSPELLDARAYELGDDAMAFDVDVRWDSEVEAKLMVTSSQLSVTMPLSVRNFRFVGVVRVVLAPLTPDPPGFGAALISLPAAPTIGLDVRMAGGELTRMPWLRSEIMSTIQRGIADEFLWPRRMVIPSAKKPRRRPKTMLSNEELTELSASDPLLRAERELAEKPAYQESHLDSVHQIPEEEAMKMDILVKDENCEEEEETCIVETWSSSPESGSQLKAKSHGNETTSIWGRVVEVLHKASNMTSHLGGGGEGEGKQLELLNDNKPPHLYVQNLLETFHPTPKPENLQMDILVKDVDCDEDEEPCIVESWSTSSSASASDDTVKPQEDEVDKASPGRARSLWGKVRAAVRNGNKKEELYERPVVHQQPSLFEISNATVRNGASVQVDVPVTDQSLTEREQEPVIDENLSSSSGDIMTTTTTKKGNNPKSKRRFFFDRVRNSLLVRQSSTDGDIPLAEGKIINEDKEKQQSLYLQKQTLEATLPVTQQPVLMDGANITNEKSHIAEERKAASAVDMKGLTENSDKPATKNDEGNAKTTKRKFLDRVRNGFVVRKSPDSSSTHLFGEGKQHDAKLDKQSMLYQEKNSNETVGVAAIPDSAPPSVEMKTRLTDDKVNVEEEGDVDNKNFSSSLEGSEPTGSSSSFSDESSPKTKGLWGRVRSLVVTNNSNNNVTSSAQDEIGLDEEEEQSINAKGDISEQTVKKRTLQPNGAAEESVPIRGTDMVGTDGGEEEYGTMGESLNSSSESSEDTKKLYEDGKKLHIDPNFHSDRVASKDQVVIVPDSATDVTHLVAGVVNFDISNTTRDEYGSKKSDLHHDNSEAVVGHVVAPADKKSVPMDDVHTSEIERREYVEEHNPILVERSTSIPTTTSSKDNELNGEISPPQTKSVWGRVRDLVRGSTKEQSSLEGI